MNGVGPTTAAQPQPGPTGALPRGVSGSMAAYLGFAEALIRQSNPGAIVTCTTVQVLAETTSSEITGEARCLSTQGAPVWRVVLHDPAGLVLAEVTLTLSPDIRPVAAVLPIEPVARAGTEDRRERIALAAQEVFADKGYAAATMREVAAAAGMHVPTMYQYVRSKEEMLELVYAWTIDRAVAGMEGVLSASGPAGARVDAIVQRLHDVNAELRRGTLVMNRETRSLSREARSRVLGRYAEMVRRIGDVVAQGQREGVFRPMDPQLAAVFIDSLADVWVLRPFAVNGLTEEAYAADLAAFVRGALADDPANKPAEDPANKPDSPEPTDPIRRV